DCQSAYHGAGPEARSEAERRSASGTDHMGSPRRSHPSKPPPTLREGHPKGCDATALATTRLGEHAMGRSSVPPESVGRTFGLCPTLEALSKSKPMRKG